jgi:hypothetical protein
VVIRQCHFHGAAKKKRHTIRRVGLWISVHPIGWPPFTCRKKAWCYEKQWVTGLIVYLCYFDDLLQCYIFSQYVLDVYRPCTETPD